MLFFSIYDEKNEVISENRFRTVASPGACERLAVFIDVRRQYILFVDYIHLFSDDEERFVWVIGSLQILSRICGRFLVLTSIKRRRFQRQRSNSAGLIDKRGSPGHYFFSVTFCCLSMPSHGCPYRTFLLELQCVLLDTNGGQ